MPKNTLAQVLLDFGRTPGRYALRLREPQELYAQFDTVALWAQGRVPEALQGQAERLKAAAVLFIQRACFAQESNHYQTLGLVPGPVDTELLRTRYRSMIRLTHPDMGVEGLPNGAAGLVNRAQKVLADPALREQYDQELKGNPGPRWQGAPSTPAPSAPDLRRMARPQLLDKHDAEGLGERWRALWARYPTQLRLLLTTTGIGALVVALLAWAANDAPGGALVVVRAPAAYKSMTAERAAPQTQEAPALATAAPSSAEQNAVLTLSRELIGAGRALKDSQTTHTPPDSAPSKQAQAPARAEGLREVVAATAAPTKPAAQRDATPTPNPQAMHDVADTQRAKSSSVQAAASAASQPSRQASRAPAVLAAAAPPNEVPAPAPALARPQAVTAPAETSATLEPSSPPLAPPALPIPATSQWTVDVPGATQYLRDLIALLENPKQASRTQELLRSMNVKGNLLAPAVQFAQGYSQLRVSSVALGETRRAGTLELRGTVQVQAQSSAASNLVQYRVAAYFVGLEGGTALTRLELVEAE